MKLSAPQLAPDARRCFQFSFPALDTFIQLESSSRGVVIRATRNSFSDCRKLSFIRELAAEGFIDEVSPVCWFIDSSWVMPDNEARERTNSFMIRLIAGATVLWFAALTALFLRSH